MIDKATALMERRELDTLADAAERHLREKLNGLSGCTSYVQRKLQCGYNRAATLLEILEQRGVLSEADRFGERRFLK